MCHDLVRQADGDNNASATACDQGQYCSQLQSHTRSFAHVACTCIHPFVSADLRLHGLKLSGTLATNDTRIFCGRSLHYERVTARLNCIGASQRVCELGISTTAAAAVAHAHGHVWQRPLDAC
jgi:hypothetical protein